MEKQKPGPKPFRLTRGICEICGQRPQKQSGYRDGVKRWKKHCWKCDQSNYPRRLPPSEYRYRVHKGAKCERCGFIPEDPCQLDVDHADGNRRNNEVSNLHTLCANCHRLKTKRNGDGPYRFRA